MSKGRSRLDLKNLSADSIGRARLEPEQTLTTERGKPEVL